MHRNRKMAVNLTKKKRTERSQKEKKYAKQVDDARQRR